MAFIIGVYKVWSAIFDPLKLIISLKLNFLITKSLQRSQLVYVIRAGPTYAVLDWTVP